MTEFRVIQNLESTDSYAIYEYSDEGWRCDQIGPAFHVRAQVYDMADALNRVLGRREDELTDREQTALAEGYELGYDRARADAIEAWETQKP